MSACFFIIILRILRILHILMRILRIPCVFICIFCVFCIFCLFCLFCLFYMLFLYLTAKCFVVCLDQMTYFAYCIAFFPEWVGQKIRSKCPYVLRGWRDSNQGPHRHQPSALPTKPLRATTVKSPWSNGEKKGCLLNCWTIALFPMKGPSFWHNITCTRPLRPLVCHRQHQESQQINFASQMELSLLTPLGQEEGVPVWRIQELHSKLAHFLGARRRWLIGMYPNTLCKTDLNIPK